MDGAVKKTPRKRSGLWWFGIVAFALLALFFLVIVLALLWINSGMGRDFVESRIEALEIAGQTVELDGLEGSVLGAFEIDRLVLSGRDGDWLVARDVAVDWSPRALIGKRLDVTRLRVGDLDVLDRPILVPSESGGGAPVEVFDVSGVELPDIFLAESVTGRDVQLSAEGGLRHGPQGGRGVLNARSDQGDVVEADLDWSPELVLSGDAQIEGAPNGLIASLLRLDPRQAVSADVTTQDSVTQVEARIDGQPFADLSIERMQSRVALSGTARPERLPILEAAVPLLGGAARVDLVWPLDQNAPAEIDLSSPRLTLSAQGRRQDGVITMDRVRVEAETPLQGYPQSPLAIGRLVVDGTAVIANDYTFQGDLIATDVIYQDYRVDRLEGLATLRYADRLLDFDLALTGEAASTLMARANGARVNAAGRLDLEAQRVTLDRADIALPGLAVNGRGTVGYGDASSLEFSGRYDIDTAAFADGRTARLSGQATLTRTANGNVIETTGQARNIEGLPEAVAPLAAPGLDYTAQVRLQDGQVIVPRFRAENERLTATGSGRYADGQIEANIDYTLDRYEQAALSAEAITGQATLSGPLDTIAFETDLTAQTLTTGNLETTDARATVSGSVADGTTTLTATVSAESEQGRVETRADVSLTGSEWTVENIQGTLGDLEATGGLTGLGGDIAAIRGDLRVSGRSPLLPAESIEADIRLGDARVDVEAQLKGVNSWRLEDGTVTLTARGPREAVAFTLAAEGRTTVRDIERMLTLTATGTADLTEAGPSGDAAFDLALGGLEMSGQASARRGPQGWGGTLDAQGLGGTIDAAFDPDVPNGLTFTVDELSVAQLAALLARPVSEGTLSATGTFGPVGARMEGEAQVTLANLRSPISDAEAVTLVSDVVLRDERLLVTAGAGEGGLDGRARLEGAVETLAQPPYLVFPPAVPLQGTADLNGDIGPLAELFLPPQTDVSGVLNANLSFTVPNTPTGLQGRVALTEGRFEQGALGLRLEEVRIVAELSGETINVPILSARGVDGGSLSGSGRMGLGDGTGTVRIEATELLVVDRQEGRAEVGGTLEVSRTVELLRLGGDLQVTKAEIDIGRLPEPGLPTLDVSFGDEEEEDRARSFASTATELDIRVTSTSRIEVKGRGLDADMSLNARVTGSFDAPTVAGRMDIDRGRFDFLSKRFVFRDSSVLLRPDAMKSALVLEAVRETPDLTALVRITGTLDRPEIELTSEPALPEDEVLSRVLFGRSPTQLSAIETARLAGALAQLSGGSGLDLFGSLEDAVGLDTLDIGQNETGQTELATGKYLSNDVYLEVRTTSEGTPGIAVEWQVRDNISLEAETLSNERQRLSVQWRKDFD